MISAVILAAGESKRMGEPKQLLPWRGKTILETVIGNVASCSGVDDEIRVVLGARKKRIEPLVKDFKDPRVRAIENPDYREEMLTSVRRGLEDLPDSTRGVMLVLGDQPLISPEIFSTLVEEFIDERPYILLPISSGERGHPLLLKRELVPEVNSLDGPGGLRKILEKYSDKVRELEVDDDRIHIDLDHYEEYKKYRKNSRD
ncbi:MAG: NTP transferase domain-containing protein [Candidatus Bipolaricaulia bacterium]